MKKVIALILTMMMVFQLVGCASKEVDKDNTSASGSETTTNQETETTTSDKALTVAIWDNNQRAGLQEIMNDWTATSGVKVDVQVISWDEYWTLLEAGASGGTLPDVFWMHSNNAQRYMENDLLLDITDKIAASDKIKLDDYYEDIVSLYMSDGKHYAMPKDIDTIGLWYNKTMFDEAGLAYPSADWTWEDLADAAKTLTKADGSQYGYAINTGNNQDSYYNTIYSYGGYVLSEDKKKSGYDDPNTIAAMEVIERMLREGSAPSLEIVSENGTEVLFNSGKVYDDYPRFMDGSCF